MATTRTPGMPHQSAPWRWAIAGVLLGGAIATTVFAPARWLATALSQASGQQLQLVGAQGSIWGGTSQLVLSGGQGSVNAVALPGQVSWRIRPVWAGLAIQISADCCTPQPLQLRATALGWKGARLVLQDSQTQWPASLLAGLGTPWNTVQAQGQLSATTQDLVVEFGPTGLQLAGRVQLDALNISSRLSTLSPMGSYRFLLQGGPSPSLALSTLEGSLQLSGQGEWVGQRLRFTGVASAAPERVEALSNLLNILGRRDGARSIITVG
ncbi:type II secretion system protein N [Rhodoferax sp. AJA081-3]|uniref:type II secretion system protein N n=1 Tax=Rhodoferax sp. AJA081-3 TaxID=2752316 RepID=UPI001AE0165D|nr:type II secretion system protein N [Rhodoferax sp. AJA081-3]QTN26875.1 type II secretion system protein N [Rhodoferax sp. AJA081-3]